MNRIQKLFARTRAEGRGAFVAYLTMGAPTLEASVAAADVLLAEGADILELGVPFSDPMADGPVIRAAARTALDNGTDLSLILKAVGRLRAKHPDAPLVVFSYYNIIYKYGLEQFAADAADAGADAVLAVDVPYEDRDELLEALRPRGLTLVPLIAPTTGLDRVKQIAAGMEDSFLYVVTVKGTTGVRNELPPDLAARLSEIKAAVDMPVCAGFGVSSHEQAEMISKAADGYIIGSAIMRVLNDSPTPAAALADFVHRIRGRSEG